MAKDNWLQLCSLVEADDNLPVRDCGPWTANKLFFWNRYIQITTQAMIGNPSWPAGVVYVDLFSGPGVCRNRDNGERIPGSPIIAANAPKAFRRILLCEIDNSLATACEHRLDGMVDPGICKVFTGDSNARINEIVAEIPKGALTLAFVDQTGLQSEFETIRTLSNCGRVDLLIYFADAVDMARNVESTYLPQSDSKLDRFLGPDSDWKRKWSNLGNVQGAAARQFFTRLYKTQLTKHLGYKQFGEKTIDGPHGPLYKLIYASKHERGLDFWDKVTSRDRSGQKDLF